MCWTTTTGTGRLAGSEPSTLASASGPPVEAAMAIALIRPVRAGGCAGRRAGTAETGAATPGRPPRLRILGISCSRIIRWDSATLPTLAGLVTKSVAPAASASRVAVAPATLSVLNMMTGGVRRSVRRSSRRVPRPSSSGISMSSVTTSGRNDSILVSAIRPLAAVPTTSMSGWPDSASTIRRRTTTESSTTRTETTSSPPPSEPGRTHASRTRGSDRSEVVADE